MVCCKVKEEEESEDLCKTRPVIGTFNQRTFHTLSGKVVAKDAKTLLLCNFNYDGQGPVGNP